MKNRKINGASQQQMIVVVKLVNKIISLYKKMNPPVADSFIVVNLQNIDTDSWHN